MFALSSKLLICTIPPLSLSLIDGTINNFVSQIVSLPIKFACSTYCQWEFFVTPLDGSCEVVLGHDRLRNFNPKIDWKAGSLDLTPSLPHTTKEPTSPSTRHTPELPKATLIGAAAFVRSCKAQGALPFQIILNDRKALSGRTSHLGGDKTVLDPLPADYHTFADVFDKHRAKHLPPHCSHDLSIHIEGGSTPPLGPIYSLSTSELRALREFIDENTRTGLIRSDR